MRNGSNLSRVFEHGGGGLIIAYDERHQDTTTFFEPRIACRKAAIIICTTNHLPETVHGRHMEATASSQRNKADCCLFQLGESKEEWFLLHCINNVCHGEVIRRLGTRRDASHQLGRQSGVKVMLLSTLAC